MKKVLPAFLVLSLLLTGLVIGAGYALKAGIEDMTRNTVLNLMGPGESSVTGVSFNPLTRIVTVTGWSTTYRIGPEICNAQIEQAQGTITIQGLVTCLPLIDSLFFDDKDIVPVIKDLHVKNCTWQGVSILGRASRLSLRTVSLPYSLAKQYYTGSRPPFIASVNGFRTDYVLIEDLAASKIKRGKASSTLTAKKAELENLLGASAQALSCTDIFCGNTQKAWTAESLSLKDIRISPELLSELVAYGRSPLGFVPAPLKKSLDANGRIFSHAEAKNAGCTAKGQAIAAASSCTLDWHEENGQAIDMRIEDMRIPARSLPPDLAPGLSGMKEVCIRGEAHIANLARPLFTASFALADLADIKSSILLHPESFAFSNVQLAWQDHGLMSRLARCVSPEPHLSSMVLKAAAMQLCSGDSGQNREQCENITAFIDRPGTLSISMRPEIMCPIMNWPSLFTRFGSFFEVQAVEGSKSLTEQSY